MKVSVLIAVYNAEKYLPQCLDSLLRQTHEDFEALCVDDCSTDLSLDILTQYSQKDTRIKVFHLNENSGQAVARNHAIKHTTGQYICFLDSDDWLSDDALHTCLTKFQQNPQADCVLLQLIKVFEDSHHETYDMNAHFPMTGEEAFRLSLDWSIHGVYMVKADIQRQYPYDTTCRTFSDDNTTRLHYLNSRQVDYCQATYFYRQNPNSVSHVQDITRMNFLIANEHMHQMLKDLNVADHLISLHEKVRWLNLIGCYHLYHDNRHRWTEADRLYALNEMKRIWKSIEPHRLPFHIRLKPGYMHLPTWTLFRMQEEVFYFLKTLSGL